MNHRTKCRIFEKRIEPEYERIYHFVCAHVRGDTHLAWDITQDAMESIWDKLEQLKNQDSPDSWILKIVLNEMRKYFRGRQAQKRSIFTEESLSQPEGDYEIPDETQPDVLDIIIANEEKELLMGALSRIDEPYSLLLELRLIYDLPFKDIAESLQMKEGTARVYYQRAVKMLAEEYRRLTEGGEDYGT